MVLASLPSLVNQLRRVFLKEWLVLFGYPCGSAAALLGGVLFLPYCSGRFACSHPSWSLPAHGHFQGLITEFDGAAVVSRDEQVVGALLLGLVDCSEMLCGSSTEELQHTLQDTAGMGFSVSATGLEEI